MCWNATTEALFNSIGIDQETSKNPNNINERAPCSTTLVLVMVILRIVVTPS